MTIIQMYVICIAIELQSIHLGRESYSRIPISKKDTLRVEKDTLTVYFVVPANVRLFARRRLGRNPRRLRTKFQRERKASVLRRGMMIDLLNFVMKN